MRAVPEPFKLAAFAAAAKLRERAATLRPDEDLAASITNNAAVADEFARAYAPLREVGLQDKVLDRFGIENATATEMREAAELLEQLARSEDVPGRRKKGERHLRKSVVRNFRAGAILVALLLGIPILGFGGVFLVLSAESAREWWLRRDMAPAPSSAGTHAEVADAPPLAAINHGFEYTPANQLVPKKPRDYVTDRAGILPAADARALNARLAQFERETSNQVLVFVDEALPPDTPMEEMTSAAIRHWGVGQQGKDNGAIFFVFMKDRKMRIEVGYGLESVLTDARSKRIISEVITPRFQQDQMAEGIESGALAMMDVTRGGDAALDLAASAAVPTTRVSWIVPALFFFLLGASCVAFALYIFRSVVLFLQGRGTGMFEFTAGGGRYSGGSGSSSSDSGGGSSGGSFDSGGGSGGGGSASGSW